MGQSITLQAGDSDPIGAWACAAVGERCGGVVVAQEIFGVNQHIRALVERFAEAGYSAIAPAYFDHVESGVELGYDKAGFQRGKALAARLDMDQVVADTRSAAARLAPAGKVAVVGYCWGGTAAFVAGLRLALPAVSFYGSRNINYLDEPATAPQQFHFGEQDQSIPPAAIEQHRQAYPEAEIFTYPAGHGFNCELRDGFAPQSADLARQRTLDFLARHL